MVEVKAGPRSCCVRSRRALCVVGVDAIHAVAEAAGDCLAAGLRLIAVDFHAVNVGRRKARGGEGLSGGSDVPVPDGRLGEPVTEFKAPGTDPAVAPAHPEELVGVSGSPNRIMVPAFECGQLVA